MSDCKKAIFTANPTGLVIFCTNMNQGQCLQAETASLALQIASLNAP